MPQQMPGLTIDLSSDASHVSHHLSSPIDLHGIDISSLDARDTQLGNLASLTPLPLSPDERERGAAKSFFGNRATSPSAGRIRDEPSVSTASMDPHGEASSHNITTWTQTNAKTPADSPAESGSQEGSRFGDGQYCPFLHLAFFCLPSSVRLVLTSFSQLSRQLRRPHLSRPPRTHSHHIRLGRDCPITTTPICAWR